MSRPNHQRTRPVFAATFERDHHETIAAMDEGGHDIPRQTPRTPLALRRIGLKRRAIPVRIRNPLGDGVVELSAEVETALELGAGRRGIHVSRIGDVLARCSARKYNSLSAFASALAGGLSRSHDGAVAHVFVEATLTYEETISGVKEKLSLEHLQLFAEARSDRATGRCGLGFHHITACPCVQETFRHSFVAKRSSKGKEAAPLLTHTQRCETRVTFSAAAVLPPLPALLNCIDAVVVRSQNTLPREFELLNVYRAHAGPQFLEDVLRDLLFALYGLMKASAPAATLCLQSTSMESIHDFDLVGEIEFSVAELDCIFAGGKVEHNVTANLPFVRPIRKPAGRTRADRRK